MQITLPVLPGFELTGARSAVGASGGVGCADRLLSDGDTIVFGN